MFSVADVGDAQFEVCQVDSVLVFSAADDEVARLDIPVDHLVAVQVLNSVDELQSHH